MPATHRSTETISPASLEHTLNLNHLRYEGRRRGLRGLFWQRLKLVSGRGGGKPHRRMRRMRITDKLQGPHIHQQHANSQHIYQLHYYYSYHASLYLHTCSGATAAPHGSNINNLTADSRVRPSALNVRFIVILQGQMSPSWGLMVQIATLAGHCFPQVATRHLPLFW
jgi:hypothetical protein